MGRKAAQQFAGPRASARASPSATATGRWSASSRAAATCTSPRSGPTPRSRCRPSGARATSRSPPRLADGSDAGPRRPSRTRSAAIRASRSACCASPSTTPSRPRCSPSLINVLGYTVAAFMAVGATFGALNCMYSAIASRQVEIATLRAIGFGGTPVVVSVMIEALAAGAAGRRGRRRARLRLLRRRLALHAQLQHLLPGGLRLPGDAGPAPPGPRLGAGHRAWPAGSCPRCAPPASRSPRRCARS